MALFKVNRGPKANLPSTKTDGYAYFCTDDGSFWIDYKDRNGILQRKQVDAGTVGGHIVQIDVPADAKFTDTTYSVVTTSENGLMSYGDKTKLDGIEVGANKTIVDSTLSATSTNPVQNKVVNTKFETIQAEVDSKVDSIDGKGLSTEDYTTEEKTKLVSIAEGAEVNVQADWNEADTSSDAYIVNKPTIPSKTSDLTNDSGFLTSIPDEYVTETELTAKGYLTSYTETDPTVPAWAKQPEKPTYTAAEVGAIAETELQSAIDTALAQAKASGEFDGADGYTPVKGTDYFTEADKTELVNAVLAALPEAEGVSY